MFQDLRVLFVPWIFAIIIATTVDVTHSIYLYGNNTVNINLKKNNKIDTEK